MKQIAKVFTTGRSQAVRLPAAFRFDTKEVYVRRDEATGDVVLSRRAPDWATFFALVKQLKVPADFMSDRRDAPPQKRDLF
ncbi:MAG: type II toxin-antitoxin system VapB family antitoxin [Rubrivivax sp.]